MSEKAMRQVFGETLVALADEFPAMTVLDADVSTSTRTCLFAAAYPDRFFNFGIAEGNMIAAAAGMATAGKIPVASTFAFLIATRALDSVSSLITYNNLNVKLCGGYAGLSDFADGASHQSLFDLAIMRALPNIRILCPSDAESTRAAVREMLTMNGPVYLRLSRAEAPSVHESIGAGIDLKNVNTLADGEDAALVVTGTLVKNALEARAMLMEKGVSVAIVECACIKPLDEKGIRAVLQRYPAVFTLEEHSVIGGLGDAVCAQACECAGASRADVFKMGIHDEYGGSARSYAQLLSAYGLRAEAIAETVCKKLSKGRMKP